ncbi:YggS family pyridoxal phosphate-dependent enzyme [Candidatus Bipolaricaulota bacterium]|nr:YggS family pyridoxal phosphate-dependent enzyme [Candidatus Bipolaricaulota bacterium]
MIEDNVKQILAKLPPGVTLVAAAKTRTPDEILRAIAAGITVIGENYIQEAREAFAAIGKKAAWHFIGRLQKNKVKRAVEIFDMIETVDSMRLAERINRSCAALGRTMPVLIEINSGREPQKAGVLPEEAEDLLREMSTLEHISVRGLMTMGPRFGDPEEARPYFKRTKDLFDQLGKEKLANAEMRVLSMGMSNTYNTAIEEGANMVRIGTRIFGEREKK